MPLPSAASHLFLLLLLSHSNQVRHFDSVVWGIKRVLSARMQLFVYIINATVDQVISLDRVHITHIVRNPDCCTPTMSVSTLRINSGQILSPPNPQHVQGARFTPRLHSLTKRFQLNTVHVQYQP